MKASSQETRRFIPNLQCFVSIFMWASGFVALEFLLDDWGALSLNALRLGVSAVVLFLWWVFRERYQALLGVPWLRGLSIGAIGWGLGSLMLFLGQRMSDPVTTTVVVAMMPLAGAAIEIVFDKRRLSTVSVLGILLALYGGYLATGVSIQDTEIGLGILLCLTSIFLFAWATRATTRQLDELGPTGQTTVTMIGGAIFSVILYCFFWVSGSDEVRTGEVTSDVVIPFLVYLIPSSGIAQLLWIFGAGRLGIMIASFHMNAAPFYVMLILVALSHGDLELSRALGAGMVILGVIVAQLKIGAKGAGARQQTQSSKSSGIVHYKQAMKLTKTLLHAGVLILLSTTALASERGRAIYESQCVACHGNPGLALKTPLLHGQERAYLVRSLQAFQLGGRIDQIMSSMNGIAAGLSDADIAAVASYLAGQDACDVNIEVDFNREGFREEFKAGKDKYMQANCSHCHDSFHHYAPRIVGQKAEYLRLALSQFKAGVRVAPMMATILDSWTDDDFENVVTYLSGLRLMRACDG